jgi:hypothetical protein
MILRAYSYADEDAPTQQYETDSATGGELKIPAASSMLLHERIFIVYFFFVLEGSYELYIVFW